MEVLRIKSEDTYPIRHRILRPDGKMSECHFPGDQDELTFHLGAFIEKKLVSIASFYYEKNPYFIEPYQFRLRGMATLETYRHQGLSSALLKTAFSEIKRNNCRLLWCNARTSAEGFYEKLGFIPHGEVFDIPTIGPHKLMSIKID